MDETGEKFCKFFMEWLRNEFKKFPKNVELGFYLDKKPEKGILCIGKREEWEDARLWSEVKKIRAGWLFLGESDDEVLCYFLKMILEELEKRFKNILHLEVLEKQIEKPEELEKNELAKALLGEMLEREWMINRFAKKMTREKDLPPLEFLIQISAQKYEQRITETKVYFAQDSGVKGLMFAREEEAEEWQLIPENLRAIRKMIEMPGRGSGLLAVKGESGYSIAGIISMQSPELPAVCVAITGHLSWTAWEKGQILFEYREGKYRIPALEGGEKDEKWRNELHVLLDKHPKWGIQEEALKEIIELLKRQEHGTSIVFMEQKMLEGEQLRLMKYKRAYALKEPFFPILKEEDKNKAILSSMKEEYENRTMGFSAVDGAIIADAEGKFHLVGAILDGEALVTGRSDRGARYNSLSNYVNWAYKKYEEEQWCFAFVLSEDKTVDLVVPEDLRP